MKITPLSCGICRVALRMGGISCADLSVCGPIHYRGSPFSGRGSGDTITRIPGPTTCAPKLVQTIVVENSGGAAGKKHLGWPASRVSRLTATRSVSGTGRTHVLNCGHLYSFETTHGLKDFGRSSWIAT